MMRCFIFIFFVCVRHVWLPVLNYQCEVCLMIIFTFLYDFAVLHHTSTLTLSCIHDVTPDMGFCRVVCSQQVDKCRSLRENSHPPQKKRLRRKADVLWDVLGVTKNHFNHGSTTWTFSEECLKGFFTWIIWNAPKRRQQLYRLIKKKGAVSIGLWIILNCLICSVLRRPTCVNYANRAQWCIV